jgi:DNA-binding ferritin-like protein
MITNLIADNDAVLATVTEAYEMAEDMKEFGLSNYLQDRITSHKKHRWMLKATANQKA